MSAPAPGVVAAAANVVPWRVTVIGAGSLGLVLAAALARTGNAVTVLARPASASALLDHGGIEIDGRLDWSVPVRRLPAAVGQVAVTGRAAELPAVDLALFATKGQDLPAAIEAVLPGWPGRGRDGAFVAGLQNGVVKDDLLAQAFGPEDVLGAATLLGSRRRGAGTATVTGLGRTFVGDFGSATSARADALAAALAGAGLPVEAVADIRALLWTKFCHAIGIFGVSALTGLPSAEIFARRPLALAYRSLLDEAAAVAAALGVAVLDFPDLPVRTYLRRPPRTRPPKWCAGRRRPPRPGPGPPGYSSMAQDLAAGRPTEVEETFGDLVRRAAAVGVDVPRAELVYRAVAGRDALAQTEGAGT